MVASLHAFMATTTIMKCRLICKRQGFPDFLVYALIMCKKLGALEVFPEVGSNG